jgi:DNA polymerase-1
MGDKSDNIPGVSGIGEKTAVKLISEYGSLENLYEHLEEIKSVSVREKLRSDKDNAFLSRELGEIYQDCPMEQEPEDLILGSYDEERLLELFKKLEFNTFIKKYGLTDEKNVNIEVNIHDSSEYPGFENAVVYCSMDDDGLPSEASFTDDGINVYILHGEEKIFDALKKLKMIRGHYLKSLFLYFLAKGIEPPKPVFDTAAAAYLADALKDTYGVDELAVKYLNMTFSEDTGIADRVSKIFFLEKKMSVVIGDLGMKDLLNDIELPLIEVLASLEYLGFKADSDFLKNFELELTKEIDRIALEVYSETGSEFNINSPMQLGKILFEDMNLPYGKKKKNGFSTNADILEKLAPQYKIAALVLEYRKLSKLKSTYTTGLVKAIASDGRIHSNFRQTVTATGRLSSTEPNLQNLPVRTEIGREIRKAFVPGSEEYLLTSADYSQIELRVLAHVSDDREMKIAFKENRDIHTMTAAKVFGVDDRFVNGEMRRVAKAVNFGIIYGISDFSLAGDINVSVPTAREYINEYLNQYPGIKKYMSDIVSFAQENGYVQTIFGRRRYIPELESKNYNLREFGKRVALNAPIQGAAADIIKKAMNDVYYRLIELGMKSRLILQVHDELVIETHIDEVEKVENLLKECMEGAVNLSVPLTVEVRTGKSLYETK